MSSFLWVWPLTALSAQHARNAGARVRACCASVLLELLVLESRKGPHEGVNSNFKSEGNTNKIAKRSDQRLPDWGCALKYRGSGIETSQNIPLWFSRGGQKENNHQGECLMVRNTLLLSLQVIESWVPVGKNKAGLKRMPGMVHRGDSLPYGIRKLLGQGARRPCRPGRTAALPSRAPRAR